MKKTLLAGLAVGVMMLGMACVASATPITFIHSGSGSGDIDGTGFTSTSFTITATGDTDDRASLGYGYFIDHLSASINIFGVGSYDFALATRTFVNNSSYIVGFSRGGITGADLFNGPRDTVFTAWDMTTSIGPITGGGDLMQWWGGVSMDGGHTLSFNDGSTLTTFQATTGTAPVPEPATMLLMGTGLAGLIGARRKKKA